VNLRRVRPGDWAVGVCGTVLIGSLWLPWFHTPPVGTSNTHFATGWTAYVPLGTTVNYNAWQTMSVNDVLLFVAGGFGVAVVIAGLTQASGAIPIATSVFAALFGLLASILALVRLIWPPHGLDRAAGVWIGTAAALALAVTALRLLRDERRGSPGLAQVEITQLPAPRGNGA
jgi:hypothetical protein